MKEGLHKKMMRNEETYYNENMLLSWVKVKKEYTEIIIISKSKEQLKSYEIVSPSIMFAQEIKQELEWLKNKKQTCFCLPTKKGVMLLSN